MKPFHVYMLRCGDGSYYVGHTDELEVRVAEHMAGEVDGYTRKRQPVELVWAQESATREEALAFELRVKGWSRAKKEALIANDWQSIQRLAWGVRNPLPPYLREARAGASIPQPEREMVEQANLHPPSVRPEVSKDRADREAAEPTSRCLSSVRPEVSKDSVYLPGILSRDRRIIAKTITLLESTRPDHRAQADALLDTLLPHTGNALRIGISGVPGVGKSTFIEALGLHLVGLGHHVAVLTVDPSSSLSGGSILGDKTRMEKLSTHESAYIRPSPSAGTLGGVAEKTREAMLVFEAAGYDIVIVETVGVGQSETTVAGMTDFFVLMQLPNAGDDLQAIKRGVMELADLVLVNKADLDDAAAARAQAQLQSASRLFSRSPGREEELHVMRLSALNARGIEDFWNTLLQAAARRRAGGEFEARRRRQRMAWMWELVHSSLQSGFRDHPAVRSALADTARSVEEGRMAPSSAARHLMNLYTRS